MDLNVTQAMRAYAQGRPATAAQQPETGATFQDALAQTAVKFEQTLAAGDRTATAAMTGAASGQELVTALAQSQLAIETAVAVRNKVVEAYQELLRMPV